MTSVKEFRIPGSAHPSNRKLDSYKDIGLEKYITKDIGELDFPHSTLKLRDAVGSKKDLIISVVEDDPEVLKNILDHLDEMFRTKNQVSLPTNTSAHAELQEAAFSDDSPELFPATNIHCVWSTNATNHERLYGELLSSIPVNHEKVSVAILDGQLSAESQAMDAAREEYGMQVYKYLLDLKKADKIKDLFTQFQSTVPDWVVKSGYHFDKAYSGFQEDFAGDLEMQLSDIERTHDFGHESDRSYQSLEKDMDLAITTRLTIDRLDDFSKLIGKFFSTKKDYEVDLKSTLRLLVFNEMYNYGYLVKNEDNPLQNNEKSSRLSLFTNLFTVGIPTQSVQDILDCVKDEFKSLMNKICDNFGKLNTFLADRKALVTDKLDHNADLWLSALFRSIDLVLKEEQTEAVKTE